MKEAYSFIKDFSKSDSASGILLILAAILAIIFANSPLSQYYEHLIDLPMSFKLGTFELSKPILLWVNDGLMAIFFLLIGLELKRELMEGELSEKSKVLFPFVGAIGGMLFPALIYTALNYQNSQAMNGWAIPAATDIAFALGILALLGKRVPLSLKIFLTSLAIFDDIGAIIIIAFFYTSKISFISLLVAAICLAVLMLMNLNHVVKRTPYFIVGIVMWTAVLKSGVHATLAGIALAFFIPLNNENDDRRSPLKTLEHELHALVAFFILPIFAFCNSGIDLSKVEMAHLTHPVTLGIALGLFFGNQIGVFGLCYLTIKMKLAKLPDQCSWLSLYGVACLCGVGFTMSLFIGSLAFEETGVNTLFDERIGIFIGSVLSGIVGYLILNKSLPKEARTDD